VDSGDSALVSPIHMQSIQSEQFCSDSDFYLFQNSPCSRSHGQPGGYQQSLQGTGTLDSAASVLGTSGTFYAREERIMIATEYKTRLKHKEKCSDGAMAFYFERPNGFEFQAGQYVDVTLINPPETDPEGSIRSFSLASSPADEHLLIVTRIRDTAFKRVLQNLPTYTEVELEGPFGSFTLHKNPSQAAVFLAGGIGIAPFSSMILDAEKEELQHRLYLFYANQRPESAAFLKSLQELEKKALKFRFIPTMTGIGGTHSSWSGETGFIAPEMLSRYLPKLQGPIYYLAGPPRQVEAMRKMLESSGVDAADVRSEEFVGY
jgi:ferredoxin-NADP reductase